MSIASEIIRVKTNIANAYTAVSDKGGTLPATQNSANLETAIRSIPAGSDEFYDGLTVNGTTLRGVFAFSGRTGEKATFIRDYVQTIDTSQTTDMAYMFYSDSNIRTLDLSNFDTSKVTDMAYMFSSCRAIQSLDLSSFDTSKVTDMGGMFYTCDLLQSLNLSSFDTSEVTNMGSMFTSCKKLVTITGIIDMNKVTSLYNMFGNSTSNSCVLLETVNIKNLNYTGLNLTYCTALSHNSLMYLINNLITTTSAKTITLGTTNKSKLTTDEIAVATSKGWTIA